MMNIAHKITENIYVSVEPIFLAEKSSIERSIYVFSYKISIKNQSKKVIQLKRRAWTITDSLGNQEYIEGDGVVGEYPVIHPNETYTYSSYSHLRTSFGTMSGYYMMVDEKGNNMKIIIPEFVLSHPYSIQ